MATAFGRTDAPRNAAVAKSGRRPHNATASGAPDNRQFCRSRKQVLTLGAWNVRTTNDSDSSLRPAKALICRELEKANIDICALSEVRRPVMFWKRVTICFGVEEKREQLELGLPSQTGWQLKGLPPTSINDRLMLLRIPLANGGTVM